MAPSGQTWSAPGMFWKLLVVAAAAAIALRRSGAWRHPVVRALLRPGPNRPRTPTTPPPAQASRVPDRLFLALLVIAATAVATWVVLRVYLSMPTR